MRRVGHVVHLSDHQPVKALLENLKKVLERLVALFLDAKILTRLS